MAAEQARKRFVRGVFGSLLARSKYEFRKEPGQRRRVPFIRQPIVEHFLMRRVDRQALQREDFDFLLDLLENHGAEGVLFSIKPLCPTIGRTFESDDHYGAGRKDLLALLDRMERSQRLEVRFSAQLGRLYLAWYHEREAADPIEPMLEQAKAMEAQFAAHPAIAEANGDQLAWVVYVRRAIENKIRRAAAGKERPPRALPPAAPPVAPPKKPPPQVTYEPLALEVRTLDGKLVPANGRTWPVVRKVTFPGLRLLNCGPFDLFWNEAAVLLHRQKDVLEEILVDPDAYFGDVKWDGRNIWAGVRAGHIRVLTPEGKELLRVGNRQGLPECDRVLLLYPVKEGKIVAIGCFGIHNRIWAATVELVQDQARVKVFHQGTRVRSRNDPKSDEKADLAVWPTWVHGHRWGKDQPRLLWVGRGSLPDLEHPSALEINLETLEVSVSNMLERTPSTAICNSGRFLVHTINGGLVVASPPGEPLVIPDYSRVKELSTFGTQRTYILPYNGRLYVTGSPWCCVDPATWQVEPLRAERVPTGGAEMPRWGVSMHHGILFWGHRSGFYRVLIKAADR